MKISAKIDYACKALLELSVYYPNQSPLPLALISDNQHIPMKFLTQILLLLKQSGYVMSVRGKNGGYLLKKAPQEILLKDVVNDLDGLQIGVDDNGVFKDVWREVETVLEKKLASIDFETIKNRYQEQSKNVMYVI